MALIKFIGLVSLGRNAIDVFYMITDQRVSQKLRNTHIRWTEELEK